MLRIKEICKERGISLRELAKRMNVSPGVVVRMLSEGGNPTVSTLDNIAKALGLQAYELFDNFNSDLDVRGFLEVDGKIIKINGFRELEQLYNELNFKHI